MAKSIRALFSSLLAPLILHGIIDLAAPRHPGASLCASLSHSQPHLRVPTHTDTHRRWDIDVLIHTHTFKQDPEACAICKHPLSECLHLKSMALLERKSSERIYPMTVGLDSNFRQDVWVCHFHGYGIGALCPPVSMKLENVCVCWTLLLLCMGGGVWAVGGALSQGLLCGSNFWESGNRDKQGSDDGDGDGGAWVVSGVFLRS